MKKHFQFSEKEILLLTFFCVALVLFLFVMLPHLVPNPAPKVPALEISDDLKDNALLHELASVSSVCFVGDSVTYGVLNGGFPWYDPLLPYITAKVENVSLGGWTTRYLLAESGTIPSCELYVIAIGTNDVLVNDPVRSATTEEDYISNIVELKSRICAISPDAKFVFIAPWIAGNGGDSFSPEEFAELKKKRDSYAAALSDLCISEKDLFSDPAPFIEERFEEESQDHYLLDWIHPNYKYGVPLYCEAALRGCK